MVGVSTFHSYLNIIPDAIDPGSHHDKIKNQEKYANKPRYVSTIRTDSDTFSLCSTTRVHVGIVPCESLEDAIARPQV